MARLLDGDCGHERAGELQPQLGRAQLDAADQTGLAQLELGALHAPAHDVAIACTRPREESAAGAGRQLRGVSSCSPQPGEVRHIDDPDVVAARAARDGHLDAVLEPRGECCVH